MQLPAKMGGGLISSLGVFPLLLFISGGNCCKISGTTQSPIGCSEAGKECAYDSTNLIDVINQVQTVEECRQICLDNVECEFTTYFDSDADPLARTCFLFKTCDSVKDCDPEHCLSETMECYNRICGSDIVGHLDENLIDSVPNVKTELECKDHCINAGNCSWYTYYPDQDSLYHQLCFLQSELLEPISSCEGQCVSGSGPSDCSTNNCVLEMNGETSESVMLTDTSGTHSITVIGKKMGYGSCALRILAVGGGGEGQCAGGGSGYIQFKSIKVIPGTVTVINARVGEKSQPSTVTIINNITITADSGQDRKLPGGESDSCIYYYGGDGYSGGSAGGYTGGFDGGYGGDDGDFRGGSGTGEDITSYRLTHWALTPGAGGKVYPEACSDDGGCGGGGGGVLVDGTGPSTNNSYTGQGFGGGGAGVTSIGYECGLQGIILLETTST